MSSKHYIIQVPTKARGYQNWRRRVFVQVPGERGRWVLTEPCVLSRPCPRCLAAIGEPCRSKNFTRHTSRVHIERRSAGD